MLYIGVLFFLLLQYLRPQEFVTAVYAERMVFVTMLFLLPPWILTLHNRKLLRTPEDLFMFFLWVIAIISYFNYQWYSLDVPFQKVGKTLLCYLFVAHVVNSRRKLLGAVWTMIAMLFIVALIAAPGVWRKGQFASVGMFSNRNEFANAMAFMLPLALAFFLRGRLAVKLVASGVFLAGTVQVFRSESRGGLLALIAAMTTVLFMNAKSKATRATMILVGVLALVAAFSFSERLGTIAGYRGEGSAMGRVYVWSDALAMFSRRFFIGAGFERFAPSFGRDAHNTFVRAFGELGGLGLFIVVGLTFFALRDTIRITRHPPHTSIHTVALGTTGMLVGHVAGSMFTTSLYQTYIVMQFALVSALRIVADRERTEAGHTESVEPKAENLAVPPGPWRASFGSGLVARGVLERWDLWKVFGLTVLCWLSLKLFVMASI